MVYFYTMSEFRIYFSQYVQQIQISHKMFKLLLCFAIIAMFAIMAVKGEI